MFDDINTLKMMLPLVGFERSDHLHQRRFTCAVMTDRVNHATLQIQTDIVDCLYFRAKLFDHVF